jgi:hypothetical protein
MKNMLLMILNTVALLTMSCGEGVNSTYTKNLNGVNVYEHKDSVASESIKSDTSINKTTSAHGIIAVFYSPDKVTAEQLRNKLGEDNFYTVVDDNNFYNSEAMKVIDTYNIRVMLTSDRYIEFVKNDGEKSIMDCYSLESKWGVVLFDGKQSPLVTSPIDIEKDLKKYFIK